MLFRSCYGVLATGVAPSEELRAEITAHVAERLGKSFAPSTVRFTSVLPKTRSNKIMRRAIRAIAVGEPPGDLSGLEDPAALDAIAGAR